MTSSLWDDQKGNSSNPAVSRLSSIVAGNDNLITEPGLVLALYQGNATPQQSQAINEFVGGLNAEVKVRTAAQAGQRIRLSSTEKNALDSMGIDYAPVEFTQQDATTQLVADMKAKGAQPVIGPDGKPELDAHGNVKVQPLKMHVNLGGGGGGILGSITHFLGNNPLTHFVTHGTFSSSQDEFNAATGAGPKDAGLAGATDLAMSGYNVANQTLSGAAEYRDPVAYIKASGANADLARRLGYDPDSTFSMLAFNAKGYAHHDTSALAARWDAEHPGGAGGWDGEKAVLEAEAYSANPQKYLDHVSGDQSLTPQERGDRHNFLNSDVFLNFVKRVDALKATAGNDFARSVGLDPVKQAGRYAATSIVTDVVTSFAIDPLNFGLTTWSTARRASAGIKSMTDSGSISRTLLHDTSNEASKQQAWIHQMVTHAAGIRQALAEGDETYAAALNAKLRPNPYAGLLPDFAGSDRVLLDAEGKPLLITDAEAMAGRGGEFGSQAGKSKPIETYEEAVDYLASKAGMMRLTGGFAPVESTMMPGALSAFGYKSLQGRLAFRSVYRSAEKAQANENKFINNLLDKGNLDQARADGLITEKTLSRMMPTEGDAVDMVSGRPLTVLSLTDKGKGVLRSNQLRYGQAVAPEGKAGKALSIYTLGSVERAKAIVTRLTNWLPTHTNIDITTDASVDTVDKIAAQYLTKGDRKLLVNRYALGDTDTRKTIYQGLWEQTMHGAGLYRTQQGQDLIAARPWDEKYAVFGDDLLDANGRAMGLAPGHIQTHFVLPNFGKIHQASAKIGLYEATVGRVLTSRLMDGLTTLWKLGALTRPVTALRPVIETFLNAFTEGMFKDSIAAKAIARDAGLMDGAVKRMALTDKVIQVLHLQRAGQYYRHVVGRMASPDEADEIAKMRPELHDAIIQEQIAHHAAMSLDPGGAGEATRIAEQGFKPAKVTWNPAEHWDEAVKHRKGYELTDEVDGVRGANGYAHNLALWVNKEPEIAKAALERIETAEASTAKVVEALDKSRLMRHSGYGKFFWDESTGQRLDALTPAEVALGKDQMAEKFTENLKFLLTGRNGHFQSGVSEYIKTHNKAPDSDWILDNVKGMHRPAALVQPTFVALPVETTGIAGAYNKTNHLLDSIIDVGGKGYTHIVERTIQRMITSPLFAAAYGKSKVALREYKNSLMESGMGDEAAERLVGDMAAHQAWNRIARMVDDPHMKSQMDVVGRSFFAFSRATTMMLRRWSSTLWRHPEQARRLQLAAEGAIQSGAVYRDQNGDWEFYVPASGAAQEALLHAMSNLPGLSKLASWPAADFTGRVNTIIPGSSNPFQYGLNPLVSISGREIASLFPQHREWFDEIDKFFNGDQGQGRGIWATLEPTMLKALTDPQSDERNSMVASATLGGLYDMYAAGRALREGASPSEQQEFLAELETRAKSQLYLRNFFGLFSPAVLSVNGVVTGADKAFAKAGIQGLRAEFVEILNANKGDGAQASAIWAEMHPDLTVYTQSSSQLTASRSNVPATEAAFSWLVKHEDFLHEYKSVAGFFVPDQQAGEPFSMRAYRAQLEQGLRERKTPQEFLDSVRISTAARDYYAQEDQYNADLSQAKQAGNTAAASDLRAHWLAWSKDFRSKHPTFADSLAASPLKVIEAKGQMADLRRMVATNAVPGDAATKAAVAGMVQAVDNYYAALKEMPGQTAEAKAQHEAAAVKLQEYMNAVISAVPGVTDLYNGVFRRIDNHLEEGVA